MARPKKNPALVKGEFLRIPLTAEQKSLIVEASQCAQSDMAPWARDVLVVAARKELERNARKSKGS